MPCDPRAPRARPYRTLWFWLLLGWTVSAADRALTGPVVTWMIGNHVGFLADTSKPYALGGLIGGLFFAGYMLTQWPGGLSRRSEVALAVALVIRRLRAQGRRAALCCARAT